MTKHLETPRHERRESLIFQVPLRACLCERLRVDGKPPLAKCKPDRNGIRGHGDGSLGAARRLNIHL
jgi:hypothetical protein